MLGGASIARGALAVVALLLIHFAANAVERRIVFHIDPPDLCATVRPVQHCVSLGLAEGETVDCLSSSLLGADAHAVPAPCPTPAASLLAGTPRPGPLDG